MREIKFRAWDVQEREFADVSKLGICDDGSVWYVQAIDENEKEIDPPFFPNDTNDIILMQYTGLKDFKGKEIYEGSILVVKGEYYPFSIAEMGIVKFLDGSFLLENIEKTDGNYLFNVTESCFTEVIGNIYENYELLK